jgi:hypothetical protein
MKKGLIFVVLLLSGIGTWALLTSHTTGVLGVYSSGGRAAAGQDRTGGPLSGGSTCSACHGGGNFSPTINVLVKDAGGNVVTQYTAGQTYTIEYAVSSSTAPEFAFQSVALASGNANAGNFISTSTSNSRISTLNGRKYAEQQGASSTGIFTFEWDAPGNSGTGQVTFYSVGLAVNGNGGTSGDQVTAPGSISLSELIPTTIAYSSNNYCDDSSDPTPSINGNQGGTFTSAPAGLSINASNGVIDISTSTTGSYTVSYDHSAGTATASVLINPTYFVNNTAEICSNDSIFLAGAYQNTSGAYTSNLSTVKGCDSIVITNLNVKSAFLDGSSMMICEGDSLEVFGEFQSSAAIYYDSFIGVNGCDSIRFLNLSTSPIYNSDSSLFICEGDSVLLAGDYRFNSGTYIDSLQAQGNLGCDSVINYNLNVAPLNLVVTVSGVTLQAQQVGASYQWMNCSTNTAIAGATQQSYTTAVNGDFKVVVELGGTCSDTSDCYAVNSVGLVSNSLFEARVYPNPSEGQFTLSTPVYVKNGLIRLFDTSGKLVYQKVIIDSKEIQINTELDRGIYQLVLTDKGVDLFRSKILVK